MPTPTTRIWVSLFLWLTLNTAFGQTVVDGKTFKRYRASDFSAHRGLFYTVYAAPLVTVDPLGLGGKSAYAASVGLRLNLWESMTPHNRLSGLKIHGFYLGGGYEYYPQQFNKLYGSFWLRIKTFMPIVARADAILAHGGGMVGISRRYGFGFEVKNITVLLCGEYQFYQYGSLGWHPVTESDYANQGAVHLIVPIYSRKPQQP
ncbi:MAG TPA: hypothetical protein VEB86_15640 [Chryseosolibacter sp.]|nr:hypothetical protein [Chryseosolibacter sp.]